MDRASQNWLDMAAQSRHVETVADLVVAYLEQLGVEYVFGVPGGAVEPLYDAMARSEARGAIRTITARHECGAAFMAEGYYRETGKLGVCVATSGPGATNLITGIANAFDNNVPLLAITGEPPLPSHGKRALQESTSTGVDVAAMFNSCTHYNTSISHWAQADAKIISAIAQAHQRRGPAHIAIPVDIQRTNYEVRKIADIVSSLVKPRPLFDAIATAKLRDMLLAASRPVFLIGAGAESGMSSILELISLLGIQFVTTPDAKGIIFPEHPLYRGVFGFAGHQVARSLLQDQRDLVVAVGVRFGELETAGWSTSLLHDRLIHVDSVDEHFVRSPQARLHVLGDVDLVFRELLTGLPPSRRAGAFAHTHALGPFNASDPANVTGGRGASPKTLMQTLSRHFPPRARAIVDIGNSMAWSIHYLEHGGLTVHPQQREGFLTIPQGTPQWTIPDYRWLYVSMEFCPMGWAIGTAIGLAVANRTRPVICITGDGSYLMSGQEITVARTEKLPVLFIILNDSALGMVKHGQRMGGAQPCGFALPDINFAALAETLGVRSGIAASNHDLENIDYGALTQNGPYLLDVRIDPEAVPPIGMRLQSLGSAR